MAAYALEGPRWGSGPAGTGATISWALDGTVPSPFLSQIKAAFATWSSYANLTFQQVVSTASANIGFSNSYIDGLNNVLGQAAYRYSGQSFTSAKVTFDSGEGWRTVGSEIRSNSGVNLYIVALHEIGHAVGLDHYNEAPALMNAYLSSSLNKLEASDIAGIQALYGTPTQTLGLPAPVAKSDGYAALVGQTLSSLGTGVLANDSVPNGAALSVTAVNSAAGNVGKAVLGSYGTLTLNATGAFSYTPGSLVGASTGSHLVDHFTYTTTANGLTATASLDITLDRLPVVAASSAILVKGLGANLTVDASRGVLAGAVDPDGDKLVVNSFGPIGTPAGQSVAGQYGTLTLKADGSYSYALTGHGPTAAQANDVFTFRVWDGHGGLTSANLDITIASAAVANASRFGSFVHDATGVGGKIYALYDGILGRPADPLGLAAWTNAVDHGLSVKDVARQFLGSPEGQARAGALDNAAFVEQLYSSTLHRHSEPAGLASWTAALAQGVERSDVAVSFALSPEHLANLKATFSAGVFVPDASAASAARLYHGVLGRAPDAAGLVAATSAIEAGTPVAALAQQFLASPEAQAKFAGIWPAP